MPSQAVRTLDLPEDTPQADAALLHLLHELEVFGYRFITPTPATHARVLRRADKQRARTLRDVFGWNLPFDPGVLPPDLLAALRQGSVLAETDAGLRSRVRVSSMGDLLLLHSAFPTEAEDSVFFGPDSYRFARFIVERLGPLPARARIADVGAGAGVGGITALQLDRQAQVWLTDVNVKAHRLARLNAANARVAVTTCEGSGLSCAEGAFDAVLINPPYIIDASGRAYRDGGGLHGAGMALELTLEAADRLAPGGRVLLYTGAPIVDGRDELLEALAPRLELRRFRLDYRERDPDVFGEELERPQYAEVERIAVVEAVITRPD